MTMYLIILIVPSIHKLIVSKGFIYLFVLLSYIFIILGYFL